MSLDEDARAEQHQPVEEPVEDQVEQAQRHACDHACAVDRRSPLVTGYGADFWNPTGRDLDHLYTRIGQHGVERCGELSGTIADEEPEPPDVLAEGRCCVGEEEAELPRYGGTVQMARASSGS